MFKKFGIPRPRPSLVLNTDLPTPEPPDEAAQVARRRKILLREAEMLRSACQDGNEDEVARLLKKHESDSSEDPIFEGIESFVNLSDSSGNTPLTNASTFGNLSCVQHLLRVPGIDATYHNKDGKTSLHRAAYNGHTELFAPLAEAGCDLDFVDSRGNTALHYSISNGFQDCALQLLQLGASPTFENRDGKTALSLARAKGTSFAKVVEALRAQGAPLGTVTPNKQRASSIGALPDVPFSVGRDRRTSSPSLAVPPQSPPRPSTLADNFEEATSSQEADIPKPTPQPAI